MELQYPSISLFFTFLLFMILLIKVLKRLNAKSSTKNLPPGPRQLPLIGNMHQLLVGSLPHHKLRDLANKHGPLMFLQLGETPTIVVSSAEIAEEVLKTHGTIFAERHFLLGLHILSYNSVNIMFSPYGDYWRQLRKICAMELLSSSRVQTFRSIREEEVLKLVKAISSNAPGSTVNLSKLISSLSYTIIVRAAFGGKCEDQEAFSSLVEEIVKVFAGFSIADMYPSVKLLHTISGFRTRIKKMQQKLDKILENIVVRHREKETTSKSREGAALNEDLVDVLLRIQKEGDIEIPLTDNSIKAVVFDMFSAGSETTATTVEWAMSEMLKNPRVMEKAQAEVRKAFDERRNIDETRLDELKYLQCVIKETLRLHPPAPLPGRENNEQCEINGYVIPAKTLVIVNIWAIGRDPRYWVEAELFKPERFLDSSIDYKGTNFQYIPFGAGRRICPGMLFATASMALPLAQFLYHFNWKLPNGSKQEELDMTEEFGISVRRKRNLNLIPIPYHHPSPPIE